MIGLSEIGATRARIRHGVWLPLVDAASSLSGLAGVSVRLRQEQHQRMDSFKRRDAGRSHL